MESNILGFRKILEHSKISTPSGLVFECEKFEEDCEAKLDMIINEMKDTGNAKYAI